MCAKVAARRMVADGTEGSIVFITSTRSMRYYPDCRPAVENRTQSQRRVDGA